MSLFIDVTESLSSSIKTNLIRVIESEQKNQERSVRKICETCIKYLDYEELRYDKMEDGIRFLQEKNPSGNPLHLLLLAVMHASLDEDPTAIDHFTDFSNSSLAEPFRPALSDFIAIGRVVTLKEYDGLENAGRIIIDRYTREEDITEILSNLYLVAEKEEFLPVFQRLLIKAKERYAGSLSLESLNGFINMKGRDYHKALESFLTLKDRLEPDQGNRHYYFNLAAVWENIAACYLKMGDAAKSLESCDTALSYDDSSMEYKVGNPILYRKAEALLQLGEKEKALEIVTRLLQDDEEDEKALELRTLATG